MELEYVSCPGCSGAAAAHCALDTRETRYSDKMKLLPMLQLLVMFNSLTAGEGATNVIPDAVTLAGTIRALTVAASDALRRRVGEVAAATAAAHGCSAELHWDARPYPPTVNDPGLAALVGFPALLENVCTI